MTQPSQKVGWEIHLRWAQALTGDVDLSGEDVIELPARSAEVQRGGQKLVDMNRYWRLLATGMVLALAIGISACGEETGTAPPTTSPSAAPIEVGDAADYDPQIDPADFVVGIDNPWLPFAAGSSWVYEAETDDGTERTEVVVTDEARTVMGVAVTVVRDTVALDGRVIEDTRDWYAQDRDGNVWYFGEETTEYGPDGSTSDAGSWEAGVDGALPGIAMYADPQVGQAYRQEFYEGEAEDLAEVVSAGETADVPAGSFDDVVVILEWNPLEPDVQEEKSYARGVGSVLERQTQGGDERVELLEHATGGAG